MREKSANFIDSLDFDGVAIGGLAIGEPQKEMYNAISAQVPLFNPEKPRYLMGLGSPVDIVEAVARGMDCFDSTFPTQNARHCNIFTFEGMVKLDRGVYKNDFGPLDPNCDCYVCKNFSRAFLHHLARSSEWTYHRYLSHHNIYFMIRLMERMRKSIEENRFASFRKKFNKNYSKTKK